MLAFLIIYIIILLINYHTQGFSGDQDPFKLIRAKMTSLSCKTDNAKEIHNLLSCIRCILWNRNTVKLITNLVAVMAKSRNAREWRLMKSQSQLLCSQSQSLCRVKVISKLNCSSSTTLQAMKCQSQTLKFRLCL